MSTGEKVMAFTFVCLIGLWSTKGLHGLGTATVAWIGVCILFLTRTEKWKEAAANPGAFDALIWLGGLLSMATMLRDLGVVSWFAGEMQERVVGLDGFAVAIILALAYFYSMYGFSMLTGHITALAAAFFAVAHAAGAPPLLIVALLAPFGNLCACLTNYSTGPVVIYFGLDYVPAGRWFRIGFLVSLYHLVIWLGLGLAWWKLLGWW